MGKILPTELSAPTSQIMVEGLFQIFDWAFASVAALTKLSA